MEVQENWELKKCASCGGSPEETIRWDIKMHEIHCGSCKISIGSSGRRRRVIDLWNLINDEKVPL